jgi:Fe-S cluster biogenesis protein NfuA
MNAIVDVFVEQTPNPNALKFILDRDVKKSGKITYIHAEECHNNDLARVLFSVQNVTQVYFSENVITITQNGNGDWDLIEKGVKEIIHEKIATHNSDFDIRVDEEARRAAMPLAIQEIEAILDRTIRPGLRGDGGDLDVTEYDKEKKLLTVRYQGACGSCPSSAAGTLMAIQGILRDEFDPEIEVVSL